ncbi:hypothetical protein Tco_1154393 [Tanacetum coccineum]
MLESKAYKEYIAYSTGEKTPNTKKKKTTSESSPKEKPAQASKAKRFKTSSNVAQSNKEKQPAIRSKAKSLTVLSEAALTKEEEMKLATKRSRIQTHSSHASGSGDGVDTLSKVPEEQPLKISGTDEGAGDKPKVLDVPKYNSDSEEESWTFSDGDDDDNDAKEESDAHDDKNESDDEEDDQRVHTPSKESEKHEDDDVEKEGGEEYVDEDMLYGDLNVNQERRDTDITEPHAEDTHVTLTADPLVVHQQSSLVSSYLVSKYIIPTMHEEAIDVVVQLKTNKLREEAQAENQDFLNSLDSNINKIIKEQVRSQTSKIMSKVKKYVTETLGAKVLENKSIDRSEVQTNLYNALVEEYTSDKDLLSSYGDVLIIPSRRDDKDKDEESSAGSNQGTKRRRSGKEAELKVDHLTQELLTDPTYDLLKGTPYPHDLSKPLPLIPNARGCLVIPFDHFINNALEYLKGGSLRFLKVGRVSSLLTTTNMPTGEHITRDDKLYKFQEGDFKRLHRQDIKDMLLLLVQGKLTNLSLDDRYALNVALRMYTRRIDIQERVEDL